MKIGLILLLFASCVSRKTAYRAFWVPETHCIMGMPGLEDSLKVWRKDGKVDTLCLDASIFNTPIWNGRNKLIAYPADTGEWIFRGDSSAHIYRLEYKVNIK